MGKNCAIVTRDKRLSAPKHKDLSCSVLFSKLLYFGTGMGGGGGRVGGVGLEGVGGGT